MYETGLHTIAQRAAEREEENDDFRRWLKAKDADALDALVHEINNEVSNVVDCTECGNCCNTLIINVTPDEMVSCSRHLHLEEAAFKEKYVEESSQGKLFINSIPCHFFADKKCTIYEARFTECRDFPHLHKPGFQARLLGTMGHYGRCPIIYNVIEELKEKLGFKAAITTPHINT
jgi:Fe-S-cluster containining protein